MAHSLLYILFLQLASAHHLLELVCQQVGRLSILPISCTLLLASMIHGLTIPGAMEVALRQGFNNGLFEWLRKAP